MSRTANRRGHRKFVIAPNDEIDVNAGRRLVRPSGMRNPHAALCLGFALAACATTSSEIYQPTLPPPAPRPSFDPELGPGDSAGRDLYYAAPAREGEMLAMRSLQTTISVPSAASSPPSLPAGGGADEGDDIEIEARATIEVSEPARATQALRALVERHHGRVVVDSHNASQQWADDMTIRVPSGSFDEFMAALDQLGTVRAQQVTRRDVGAEHRDLDVLVGNLDAALARYRELLAHASAPADVLAIEHELERVRTTRDRVVGRLEWLRDRVALATVTVSLSSASGATQELHLQPFQPAARGTFLVDFRADRGAYLGGGLSLQTGGFEGRFRALVLDLDVGRACCGAEPAGGDYAFDILGGFDLYSERLGNGGNRFFNPYFGLRAGYAGIAGRGNFDGGIVLGLEIVKTRALALELQTRVLGLVGKQDGTRLAIAPTLGLSTGF